MASWGPPWEAFWPLGTVLGRYWGLLEHLRSHLEPSWAILSHLGAHLGLSEALLEPSWAKKYRPTPRETPRPGPGEGVGGGVKLASSSETCMACPFPPALPQHRKQCWRNFQKTCARRKSESDILPLRAGCAPRPIPAKARGGPRRPQKVPGGPRKAPGILRRPQEAAEEPHAPDELVSEK